MSYILVLFGLFCIVCCVKISGYIIKRSPLSSAHSESIVRIVFSVFSIDFNGIQPCDVMWEAPENTGGWSHNCKLYWSHDKQITILWVSNVECLLGGQEPMRPGGVGTWTFFLFYVCLRCTVKLKVLSSAEIPRCPCICWGFSDRQGEKSFFKRVDKSKLQILVKVDCCLCGGVRSQIKMEWTGR